MSNVNLVSGALLPEVIELNDLVHGAGWYLQNVAHYFNADVARAKHRRNSINRINMKKI